MSHRARVLGSWLLVQRCGVLALSVAWALGCSVYDSSLLSHSASLSDGGHGGAPEMESGGGGSVQDVGGAPEAGAPANLGGGGSDAGAPDIAAAGDSTGGTAGNGLGAGGASAGTGGVAAAAAGTGGAPPKQLAIGKTVTASSEEAAHSASAGNDNDSTTRWCATSGVFPQWWRVDLGAAHALSQVTIQFEHPDRTYYYTVETSSDDAVYTQQRIASGTGASQTLDFPAGVSARYVRLTVTNALPTQVNGNGTWASFWELSLTGN